MADNLASSSDVIVESGESIETGNEAFERPTKKQRKEKEGILEKIKVTDERLETRLSACLCCSVCLDLPSSAVFQVNTLSKNKNLVFVIAAIDCFYFSFCTELKVLHIILYGLTKQIYANKKLFEGNLFSFVCKNVSLCSSCY